MLTNDVPQEYKLLQTVNSVAAELLGSGVENFHETLLRCLEMTGASVGADRAYIWKNHIVDDSPHCTQVYEWSGGVEPQQGDALTISIPFPPDWHRNLSNNKSINGIVKNFFGFERDHLAAQGVVSILVVPIFLNNEFWGFIGFDDCRKERVFSASEESTLRLAGILFATAALRNQMTLNLMNAKEEAIANSKAKSNFLAAMSHEIRTPMNAITGMLSITRMTNDTEKLRKCLEHIDAAAGQLIAIINDILDMDTIEAGALTLAAEPFELVPLLHTVNGLISARAVEKRQSMILEFLPPLPKVLIGDPLRISQVLFNLLTNAVKFTPEGGSIRLLVSAIASTRPGYVDLSAAVSDTGIGIASQDLNRIFTKFEQAERGITRRFSGSGLGLTICKSIAALMDGAIEVQTELGKGSTFTAHLRIREGSPEMLEQTSPLKKQLDGIFTGKRLLVADDIPINLEILATLLEKTGLAIELAKDGQEAVDKFTAEPEAYDIILMDLQMPNKDGYTATEEIRALDFPHAQSIPIIAMTAHAFPADVERSFQVGMTEHIAKPIHFESLVARMAKYLSKSNCA